MLKFDLKHMTNKRIATYRCDALFCLNLCFGSAVLTNHFTVMAKVNRHIKATQCDAFKQLIDMRELGFLGA